jgi:hypothetical protein
MNFICTWLCADQKGEESLFPQTGQKSSSKSHQDIYWRCLTVFFVTSIRFNKHETHVLFTNVKELPVVDGRDMGELLAELGVQVIFTDFKYKTPKGYWGAFQNQFYEFSILEQIATTNQNKDDNYLIVDSDCIFIKPAKYLFNEASKTGFISFEDECTTDLVINGLSRKHMKVLYEELLNRKIDEIPSYHLGEFFLASVENINKFFKDFQELWPILLQRHVLGHKKFNEEAHTLSYLYYKNGFRASEKNTFMKRIWTNPLFYRNVSATDVNLTIWHLPAEKTFGIARLYDFFINRSANYGLNISNEDYLTYVQGTLGIPHLRIRMRLEYYFLSYYRASMKRIRRFKLSNYSTQ